MNGVSGVTGRATTSLLTGPDELPIEYTSEVLQIDETSVPRGPEYWKFPQGPTDQWGVKSLLNRLMRIQELFEFTDRGYATH
jgi:hypothetical protein